MKDFFFILRRMPLARRIGSLIAIYGFVLCTATIAVLCVSQFFYRAEGMLDCMSDQIDQEYTALSEAIWRQNRADVEKIFHRVNTACRLPNHSEAPSFWRLNLKDSPNWMQIGSSLQLAPTYSLSFPISYWEGNGIGQYGLGELDITVSMRVMYQEISRVAWVSLGLGFFIVGSMLIFGYYLTYKWLIVRTRKFVSLAANGGIGPNSFDALDESEGEIYDLWRTIVSVRAQADEEIFSVKQDLKQARTIASNLNQSLDKRNHFVTRLSHELRTPMNGLIGFNSLLSQTDLSNEQREYVETMQASLESLLHVINDVADLAKIESGELDVSFIPFSIRQVVSGVFGILRMKADAKGVTLETRVSPDVPPCLLGDPGRIRQIVTNLVANALNYTERGRVLIHVDMLERTLEDCVLRISIEDTGIALDFRGRDSGQVLDIEGSTVGHEPGQRWSISEDACIKLARLLGSDIHFDSLEPNQNREPGACCWMQLVLPIVPEVPDSSKSELPELPRDVAVLVVDSVALSRNTSLELLSRWEIQFEVEAEVSDALARVGPLLSEYRYIMVLIDDRPKDFEIENALRRLKQKLSDQGAVIVLSAYPQLGDAERYFLSGASGFVNKLDRDPYLREILAQVYAEREYSIGRNRRLVTRYSVQDTNADAGADVYAEFNQAVLVVEHNIVNQQLLFRELDRQNCMVDVATNGFEAIELFKHNSYALILMDCLMPDLDGYETIQILREIERSRKTEGATPIIALVGKLEAEDAERHQRLGVVGMVSKPIKVTELSATLASVMDIESLS